MRVFYDPDISRWFVLQWASLNDSAGNLLGTSREWIAVSQTGDPTGVYNIYSMDTTDAANPFCVGGCLPDYPQIGADRYAFYLSSNEFTIFGQSFVDATILAISKSSLAAGVAVPTMARFLLPFTTGYEFAIQPVTTPPDGTYFQASGGMEYFVSTLANFSVSGNMALWAMFNSGSLQTSSPNLSLTRITVPTLVYFFPDAVRQRPGPLPYGSELFPPNGFLTFIDGGDNRILSASYAGGRIYTTVASQVRDDNGRSVVGGAYVIFSPSFRAGVLNATVLRQGYVAANGNNLLRSTLAVNGKGEGVIACSLVGPDYYPSAALIPFDTFSTGTSVQLAAVGTAPQDGFSGYDLGLARWGDNSAAVAAADGSIWTTSEYIPKGPRTEFANWGTFVAQYRP
jgi:hypothetical protein